MSAESNPLPPPPPPEFVEGANVNTPVTLLYAKVPPPEAEAVDTESPFKDLILT